MSARLTYDAARKKSGGAGSYIIGIIVARKEGEPGIRAKRQLAQALSAIAINIDWQTVRIDARV